MAFCSKCGAQLADGEKFCASCGTSVEDTASEPTPAEEKKSAFDKLPFKGLAEKIPEKTRTKVPILGKAIPLANLIICGLIVLALGVIIVFSVVRKGGNSGGSSGAVSGGRDSSPAQQAVISNTGGPAVSQRSRPGGDYHFEILSVFDRIITEDGIVIAGYTGPGGAVSIPARIENIQVVRITRQAFRGNDDITSVVIPDGVRVIDDNAFEDCTDLRSVTIPGSVTSIGAWTFDGCTSLTSVTINSGVMSIGARAFGNCTSLVSITIPSSVATIGSNAFLNSRNLTTVTLPDTLEVIGAEAFLSCFNLHTINIPAGIRTIGDRAFYNCGELYNLTIPESITTISWGTRSDRQFLGSGKLPLATRQRLSQLGYDRRGFVPQ